MTETTRKRFSEKRRQRKTRPTGSPWELKREGKPGNRGVIPNKVEAKGTCSKRGWGRRPP